MVKITLAAVLSRSLLGTAEGEDDRLERGKLAGRNEVELTNEEDEMLQRSVEMCFKTKLLHLAHVAVVNVGKHTEETPVNVLDGLHEGAGERHADLLWENGLIIDKTLNPCHQKININRCALCLGLLHCLVLPKILIF